MGMVALKEHAIQSILVIPGRDENPLMAPTITQHY